MIVYDQHILVASWQEKNCTSAKCVHKLRILFRTEFAHKKAKFGFKNKKKIRLFSVVFVFKLKELN